MRFRCGVCAGQTSIDIVTFTSYPAFLVPVPRELATRIVKAPLTLAACCQCGHFQVPVVDPEVQRLLYDVYYAHYEVDTLETMLPVYRSPFHEMVESLAADGLLPKGSLLEIGCSSGAMTSFLRRFCDSYTGIDPSERIEIARAHHPTESFIRASFPAQEAVGPFDGVVSQFNLEHIEAVEDFVAALAAVVRPEGMLLLQVPDADYYLRNGQPNFLAHEHIHYFRRPHLRELLRRQGFVIERWGPAGASIICAARRRDDSELAAANDVSGMLAEALAFRNLTSQLPALPARPVFYGVGLTLHWILAHRPDLALGATLVDDNPRYHGKGVPGYDLPILEPSRAVFSGREVLLTLNAIYFDKARERLRRLDVSSPVYRIQNGAARAFST